MDIRDTRQGSPERGEDDGFLCTVAAQSINDAILLLSEIDSQSGVVSGLKHLLTLVLAGAGIALEERQTEALSPSALDLIELLKEESETGDSFAWPVRRHARELAPAGQRALMLMVEAMSHLDSSNDLDATASLQLAIDRLLGTDEVGHSRNRTRAN